MIREKQLNWISYVKQANNYLTLTTTSGQEKQSRDILFVRWISFVREPFLIQLRFSERWRRRWEKSHVRFERKKWQRFCNNPNWFFEKISVTKITIINRSWSNFNIQTSFINIGDERIETMKIFTKFQTTRPSLSYLTKSIAVYWLLATIVSQFTFNQVGADFQQTDINNGLYQREHSLVKPYQGAGMVSALSRYDHDCNLIITKY